MKIGKIIAIAAFAAAAGQATVAQAASATVCGGAAAGSIALFGGSGQPVTSTSTSLFVKTGFDIRCSGNVFASYDDNSATLFAVGAGSAKGNQSFAGTSNGGAVAVGAKCTGTNDACTAANVNSAVAAAVTAATGGS